MTLRYHLGNVGLMESLYASVCSSDCLGVEGRGERHCEKSRAGGTKETKPPRCSGRIGRVCKGTGGGGGRGLKKSHMLIFEPAGFTPTSLEICLPLCFFVAEQTQAKSFLYHNSHITLWVS